ncbi:hypothetical protein AX15_001409 [Amanita polypyramis BW_CC]|nr:hypothetical protein AX15_001409 [Amanita polypyramis BW_CC]
MSGRTSRQAQERSSPPPTPSSSKLSKLLHKARDRSKSAADQSESSTPDRLPSPPPGPASAEQDVPAPSLQPPPVPLPRSRTRSERPKSTASELMHSHSLYSSPSSSKLSDLPTRISGWFNHTFSSSTTDLSLSSILSQSQSASSAGASPKVKLPASFLTAIPGRAVRYIFDTDFSPDKSAEPIWLLGLQHPGYEPPPAVPPLVPSSLAGKKTSKNSGSPHSIRSATLSLSSSSNSSFHDPPEFQQLGANKPGWPPAFYADFTSRVWLTYRSHFPPIRDVRLADLACGPSDKDTHADSAAAETASIRSSPSIVRTRAWPWGSGEKGWTSDSGWGCMLRTGQSLLANALIHLHLSRDWRRPPYPIYTVDYATYVQIVTWFFDTPAPEAPFSVHRMALAGKELGKDVGQWFGPSTAAGAIKTLVHSFPECGLAVAVAIDSALYQSDVYTASHGGTAHARSPRKMVRTTWGDRPVLVLLGVRLGIDRVNPIYYDTIKQLYTFPQSIGIAGGRPSSSYYFVGAQGNNLFYLDPHQSRHAIPLRGAPPPMSPPNNSRESDSNVDSDREFGARSSGGHSRKIAPSPSLRQQQQQHHSHTNHAHMPTSPSSVRTNSSNFSYHTPVSPSPLQYQYSTSSSTSTTSTDVSSSQGDYHSQPHPYTQRHTQSRSPPPVSHARWHSQIESRRRSLEADARDSSAGSGSGSGSGTGSGGNGGGSSIADSLIGGLDLLQQHYATTYSAAELKTFHCEQVRKMPMSGLDPSMLIGFLCRDEAEWVDFKRRVGGLPRTIFSIQDEPPSWPSDSDDNMGLESISDPEDLCLDGEDEDEESDEEGEGEEGDEEGDGFEVELDDAEGGRESKSRTKTKKRREDNNDDSDEFFDTQSRSSKDGSPGSYGDGGTRRASTGRSDTEEDPVDPVTPSPGSRFMISETKSKPRSSREKQRTSYPSERGKGVELGQQDVGMLEDDDDDDWVNPSVPPSPPSSPPPSTVMVEPPFTSTSLASGNGVGSVPIGIIPGGKKTKGRKSGPGLVPVVRPPTLPVSVPHSPSTSSSGTKMKAKANMKAKDKSSRHMRSGGWQFEDGQDREQMREQEQEQQHYLFPSAGTDDEGDGNGSEEATPLDRSRNNTATAMGSGAGEDTAMMMSGKRMNTARARDGGRTQSGGVKGILTE